MRYVSFLALCIEYGRLADRLIVKGGECVDDNEDLSVRNYRKVLEGHELPDEKSIPVADVAEWDMRFTLAMIF